MRFVERVGAVKLRTMKCVFAGTPAAAVPALTSLVKSSHEVVATLTRPPARTGRGRALACSPVESAAREAGIDVYTPRTLRDPDVVATLRSLDADVVAVVAYGQIVPPELLDAYRFGWVNLHFSLLPRWRGASPVQHALMAGDDLTGVSVFQIEEGLDTGPVYAQDPYPILPGSTTPILMEKLARHGAQVLVSVLDSLESGKATGHPQDDDEVTYAPMITRENTRIDFARPGEEIERLVRACSDNPGTWALLEGTRLKITRVACLPSSDLAPGELRVSKNEVAVGTATCDLLIATLAAPGKRVMAAPEWARGARLGPHPHFDVEG